jgi:3-oxoacyl-[acyl-carrier-protein] synthase II
MTTPLAPADVVVTGLGVVSPAGSTIDDFWATVLAGRSTASPLTGIDGVVDGYYFGCRVAGLDERTGVFSDKAMRRMDPFTRFGVAAALAAHKHAGSPRPEGARGAVIVGNAVGGRLTSDRESGHYFVRGPSRVNPMMPIMTMPNAAAAEISIQLGWRGPSLTIATTCASGADAIGHGAELLASGRADVVVAGGCEATLTPVTLSAFANLGATSHRYHAPLEASRPFDADRDGFVMGEGAGFVVLERRADAVARGAELLAHLAGYASTSDAFHLTMPSCEGIGAIEAMAGAIESAELVPSEIVHVNAHGTSTPLNDRTEAFALRKVLGSDGVPVTATKGVIGHLIGAAGAVELIATIQSMNACVVPPTANHQRTDPEMEIDVVHGSGRAIRRGPALANSFGFGGHNACLVVQPA